MAKTMSLSTRNEYLKKMRERYQRRPGKAARNALLDEFCAVTGHERKYANKLLRRQRGPGKAGGKKPCGTKTIVPARALFPSGQPSLTQTTGNFLFDVAFAPPCGLPAGSLFAYGLFA